MYSILAYTCILEHWWWNRYGDEETLFVFIGHVRPSLNCVELLKWLTANMSRREQRATCGRVFMTDRGQEVMSPAELEVRRMSDSSSRRESKRDTHRQTDRRSFWINWQSLMSSFATFSVMIVTSVVDSTRGLQNFTRLTCYYNDSIYCSAEFSLV